MPLTTVLTFVLLSLGGSQQPVGGLEPAQIASGGTAIQRGIRER